MGKILKWSGVAMLVPVLLVLILGLLFYFPPFQRWAVKQATAYASEEMGLTVSIGHVHLSFPMDLAMDDILILQPHGTLANRMDTVADIDEVIVDVQLVPLLGKQVMIDELTLKGAKVNTTDFIPAARIKGDIGLLTLKAHGIDWGKELAKVDHALLRDAALDVALSDSVPADTAPTENFWKIQVAQLKLEKTNFALHTPGDTLSVRALMGNAMAADTRLDLYKGLYSVGHIDWKEGQLLYDQNYEPKIKGIDYNHLMLARLSLKADSFCYVDSKIDIKVREASFSEKSGLDIVHLRGAFAMDSTRLSLPHLSVKSKAGTALAVQYQMDMNAFAEETPGAFGLDVKGQVGRQDLLVFVGESMPKALMRQWPSKPVVIVGKMKGNMQKAHLNQVTLSIPNVFRLQADGLVGNITDVDALKANVAVKAKTYDMGFVRSMFDRQTRQTVRIPYGIGFDGRVQIDGRQYASSFVATQGHGTLRGRVNVNAQTMAYDVKLKARSLPVQRFVSGMQLHPFTGSVDLKGRGFDLMSQQTHLIATAKIDRFRYANYPLDHIDAHATVQNGHIITEVDSRNPLINGNFTIDALTRGKTLRATLSGNLSKIDLYGLRLADHPVSVAGKAQVDIVSDLKQRHQIQGALSDLAITSKDGVYRPERIRLDVLTARDTTHAIVDCGDFQVNLDAAMSYEQLLKGGNRFVAELENQLKNKYIDQQRLRAQLPNTRIFLVSGKDNIVSRFLQHSGYGLDNVFMDLTTSPVEGVNGSLRIDSLVVDNFQIDTVRFRFASDDSTMSYSAQLQNGKNNPKYIFNALVDGSINERGTYAKLRLYDWKDSLGVRLSMQGTMEQNGVRLRLFGNNPILGYKEFSVNDSNYIFLGDDRRVRANMILQAADGMGLQIFTNDDNMEALQDVTVSLHRFDVGEALSMIPYTPDVAGIMDGDFHLIQTETELSLSSAVKVDKMFFEGSPMGNIGSEFTYMPREDGGHYVDGILMHNGEEVGVLNGTYHAAGQGVLDATVDLYRLPIDLANGFIPEKIIGFKGYAEGRLSVKGSLAAPDVNGEVYLDSSYVFSEPYGVEMRFANDPVTITNSRLLFENFEMTAHNDKPLTIQGYFDFSKMDQMALNIRMRADNYLLVDSKESVRSEAYGQAYVNFMGMMQGRLDNLRMRGRLDVLGTTDLKYNLKDSPLSTDNQLEGLVEFVNFKDTTEQVISRPPLTGLDMDLTINIDEGAHVNCYLNADHTNYIDIVGGGDMRMRYNVVDEVRLTGRYTIGSGEMKYSLPIIPLKTFTIQDGSYIEFKGDPMNPTLNLTATEETKTAVSNDSGDGRVVKFNSGVVVTKTLNDMGLEFIIDAPDDITIHNQLQVMSKEERGKIAVTMLTTGMYLDDGNTSGFTMNSALSAFLNSQISQLSNKALRTLDVSFDVDNAIGSNGAVHTDYSFKFAKRFWNNRLRIVIGGKLSSGEGMDHENNTFFDNVIFEYRLSPTSNKYLNLFYERDEYDWLEGDVSRFGGGFMWKRKLRHFKDIFRFNSDADTDLPAADTPNQIDSIQ